MVLNDAGIDVTLTDAARGDFLLPNINNPLASSGSGGLTVAQGRVSLSGDDTGLLLDGLLIVSGGTVNIGEQNALPSSDNGNNFIEYSSSDNASINVSGGELNVGGQVRRGQFSTTGILNYTQSGGTVRVGVENQPANWLTTRGTFEVTNNGSLFNFTGGTLEVQSGNASLTVPDILIDAQNSSSGGTIVTSELSDVSINATNALGNLEIAATGNTLQMTISPLNVDGSLTIGTGAELNAIPSVSLNVNIAGNLTNNGTYTPGTNTTTFDGGTQQIDGTSTTDFYNLTVESTNQLNTVNAVTDVANDLRFGDAGILNTNAGTEVQVAGNIINNGTHQGDGKIVIDGTGNQEISSDDISSLVGTFSNLEINKTSGRITQTQYKSNVTEIRITDNFNFQNTVSPFDIGDNLLTLGVSANMTSASGFDNVNMVKINGVESSFGLKKEFNTALTNFVFPVGSRSVQSGNDKYTPMEILSVNAPGVTKAITVRPVDNVYPSNKCDGSVADILQHYWAIRTDDVSGLNGSFELTYD